MKSLIILIAVLIVGTASFAQTKTTTTHRHGTKTAAHKHAVKKYTCSMHPEVVRSKPGKCPKCDMKLVAVKIPTRKSIMADKKRNHEKM